MVVYAGSPIYTSSIKLLNADNIPYQLYWIYYVSVQGTSFSLNLTLVCNTIPLSLKKVKISLPLLCGLASTSMQDSQWDSNALLTLLKQLGKAHWPAWKMLTSTSMVGAHSKDWNHHVQLLANILCHVCENVSTINQLKCKSPSKKLTGLVIDSLQEVLNLGKRK